MKWVKITYHFGISIEERHFVFSNLARTQQGELEMSPTNVQAMVKYLQERGFDLFFILEPFFFKFHNEESVGTEFAHQTIHLFLIS